MKEVKSDTMSHFMTLGAMDWAKGRLKKDARPILTMGWMLFKEQVDMDLVKEHARKHLVEKIHRYRAVPVEKKGWTYWVEIPLKKIDWDYHVTKAGPFDTDEEWKAFLQECLSTPLDQTRPWWRIVVVDKMPCGRSCVVSMADHALGDGASQVSATLAACAEEGGPADNPVFQGSKKKDKKKLRTRKLTWQEQLYAFCLGIYNPLVGEMIANDRSTKLKQPAKSGPTKWDFATTNTGEHLNVQMFKDIKDRIPSCTVNDVMLAVTALCIARYYEKIEDPIMKTKEDIHATYAVNIRPRGANYLADDPPYGFGNAIVIAVTKYFLHKSRLDTVLAFRDSSRLQKAGPDRLVRAIILKLLTYLPRDDVIQMASDQQGKQSIMISNVLFSLTPLRLYGQEIDDVQFIAATPLGCYLGCATYKDKVNCAIVTSSDTEADPDLMLKLFQKELKKLHEEIMSMDADKLAKMDKPMNLTVFVTVLQILVAMFVSFFLFILVKLSGIY